MILKNQIVSKIITISLSVLIVSFAVSVCVFAWTEPTQAPPLGNVSPPLNASANSQTKSGGLIINTGGAEYGLAVDQGKVGIGTLTPSEALDLASGNLITTGNLTCNGITAADLKTDVSTVGVQVQNNSAKTNVFQIKNSAGNVSFTSVNSNLQSQFWPGSVTAPGITVSGGTGSNTGFFRGGSTAGEQGVDSIAITNDGVVTCYFEKSGNLNMLDGDITTTGKVEASDVVVKSTGGLIFKDSSNQDHFEIYEENGELYLMNLISGNRYKFDLTYYPPM